MQLAEVNTGDQLNKIVPVWLLKVGHDLRQSGCLGLRTLREALILHKRYDVIICQGPGSVYLTVLFLEKLWMEISEVIGVSDSSSVSCWEQPQDRDVVGVPFPTATRRPLAMAEQAALADGATSCAKARANSSKSGCCTFELNFFHSPESTAIAARSCRRKQLPDMHRAAGMTAADKI